LTAECNSYADWLTDSN